MNINKITFYTGTTYRDPDSESASVHMDLNPDLDAGPHQDVGSINPDWVGALWQHEFMCHL